MAILTNVEARGTWTLKNPNPISSPTDRFILAFFGLLVYFFAIPVAASTSLTIGIYENEPFLFTDETGKVSGLFPDLLEHIAKEEDWQLHWSPGSWVQVYGKLEREEIDLLPGIAITKDRESVFDFADVDVFTNWGQVWLPRNSTVTSLLELDGKRIAVLRKDVHYKNFRNTARDLDIKLTFVEFDHYDDVFRQVSEGKVDAGVSGRFYRRSQVDAQNIIRSSMIFGPIRVGFAVPKGHHPAIVATLGREIAAMKADRHSYYYEAFNRWISDIAPMRPLVTLTQEERAFLRSKPIIRVSNEMDFPPFDFVANDRPAGYNIDLLNKLAGRVGLRIEYVSGLTWDELMEAFRRGELDLMHALKITPDRQKFGLFSQPYRRLKTYFVTRDTEPEVTDIAQFSGKTFAVGNMWFHQEYLRRHHPEVNLIVRDSVEQMLEAVSRGDADVTAGNGDVLRYLIKKRGMRDLKVNGWAKEFDGGAAYSHHFMGQRKAPELISMLDKALDSLTIEELDSLERKWIGVPDADPTGGLELTDEERNFLATHSVIRVSNEMDWAPFDFMQNGQPAGYSIDLMNRIAEMLGIQFEYVNGLPWYELLARFRNPHGEDGIDVMSAIYFGEFREQYALFTQPYFRNPPAIITHRDETEIRTLADLAGRRVAIPKAFTLAEVLPKEVPSVIIVDQIDGAPVRNALDALKAVVAGQADAVVESAAALSYLIDANALPNLKIAAYPRFEQLDVRDFDIYAAVRKDWPVFHRILDKAMARITQEERRIWGNRWINTGQLVKPPQIPLSPAERAWLERHGVLSYCVDPDWMPYERITETGEYQGMVADFLRAASGRIGAPFQLHPTTSWSQTLVEMKNGACDFIAAAAPTGPRREWLDFTRPHLEFPLVIAIRQEELFVENLDAVRDKTLGVVKDYAHIDLIHESHPDLQIVEVENVVDGLRRVKSRDLFGFIDTVASIGHGIRQENMLDLKIGGRFDLSIGLAVALRKGESPELLSILDKTIASFSDREMRAFRAKWHLVTVETAFDYTLLWQVMAVGGAIILVFVFWNRKLASLNRIIAKKEADLRVAKDEIDNKLLRSEERFRILVEEINDWIWEVDAQKRYTYVSPKVKDILGYEPEELIGKTPFDIMPPHESLRIAGTFSKIATAGQTIIQLENENYHKDGRILVMETNGSPIFDSDGVFQGYRGVDRDVTERRKTEEELALIDEVADVIMVLDCEGRYHKISTVSQGLLTAPREELLGKTLHEALPREQADHFLTHIQQCIETGDPLSLVYSLKIDGKEVWFDSRISPLPKQRVAFVARDITETRMQMILLENLLANIPSQVFWKDHNLVYMGCNKRFAEVVGLRNPSEVAGKTDEDFVKDPQHAAYYRALDRKIIETGEAVIDLEEPLNSASGEEGTVLTSKVPLYDKAGEIYCLLGISTDISERKVNERELRQARDAAEASNRAKSDFLANMSHEIRTPLNAILGLTHLILDTALTKKQRDYLEKSERSARSLLGVIDDILDFSKIEAGKLDIDSIPFDLCDVVEQVHSVMVADAHRKGLAFAVTIDEAVHRYLKGDPGRLGQILTNLIGNAVKFTERGGVELSIRAAEVQPASTQLTFQVRDTGIGISRADQTKLFAEFSQVDTSITRRFGGTGLGLAICHRLLEMMGGRIGVESRPGQGSTFTFTLPFALASPGAVQTIAPAPLPEDTAEKLRGARILLVEDVVLNQEIAIEILEKWGLSVEVCDNGRDAVTRVNTGDEAPYDLILMDIQMPEMDGYEATRLIRKKHPNLPIVAITAHAITEHRIACLRAGMNDHIAKPFDVEDLKTKLSQWLDLTEQNQTGERGVASGLPHSLAGIDVPRGIARLGGKTDAFLKLLKCFGKFGPSYRDEIRTAAAEGNISEMGRAAHKLRGAAGTVSATAVQGAAANLEKAMARGETADLHALVEEVESAMAVVLGAIAHLTMAPSAVAADDSPLTTEELSILDDMLETLGELLESHDFDARNCFDKILDFVGDRPLPAPLREVGESLDVMDFAKAAKRLRAWEGHRKSGVVQ